MTDRRDGFPPTPASSSTPLHDGISEQDREKAVEQRLRRRFSSFDGLEVTYRKPSFREVVDACNEEIAQALADARQQTESEIVGWLERWASNIESQTAVPDPEQIGIEHAWAARVAAAAVRSRQYAPKAPSYQRSSEGTRSGGQQTPTQNEGE